MAWIQIAIQVVLAVAAYVLAPKPKARKEGNRVQRSGVDNALERLYGTRRMSMVITNAITSKRWLGADQIESLDPANAPDIASTGFSFKGSSDFQADKNWSSLYVQGPLCVRGRENATFNSTVDSVQVRVDGFPYDDPALELEYVPVSNSHALYLSGGTRDGYAEQIPGYGLASDQWTDCIHASCMAWQHLTSKSGDKALYKGIPEWSFVLESNKLYDPRTDGFDFYNPTSWTGAPDNPALQLLDYLLDQDYGVGVEPAKIDFNSFILMANICDIPISTFSEDTVIYENAQRTLTNRVSGINDEDQIILYLEALGWTENQISDYLNSYQASYYANTRARGEVRQLMESNITLDTEDSLNSNIEQLLFALRGARLFKSRRGQWKLAPAWIVEEDVRIQTITGVSGLGPFEQNFAELESNLEVRVNDVPVTFTQVLTSDSDDLDTTLIAYGTADYDQSSNELVINFNLQDTPAPILNRKYVLINNTVGEPSKVTFVPTGASDITVDASSWTVDAVAFVTTPNTDQTYTGTNSIFKSYTSFPEFRPGVTLNSSVSPSDVIEIEYLNTTKIPGIELAAHIVATPEALDTPLDYDAREDGDGIPLIQILDEGSSGYASVTLDDKLNQCTIKFPDEFLNYQTNEVTWPNTDAPVLISTWNTAVSYSIDDVVYNSGDRNYYIATSANTGDKPPSASWSSYTPDIYSQFLHEDNQKDLTREEEVNSITSRAHALDLAEFLVRQSRSSNTIRYKLAPTALMLEPNDLVKVTDPLLNLEDVGESNRYWRVVELKINSDASVDVSFIQYETEDYTYVSEGFADDKFETELSPISQAQWADPPFVKFPLGSDEGSGRLQWIAPSFGSIGGYVVHMANARTWVSSGNYPAGAIVWYENNNEYYRAARDITEVAPGTDDSWEIVDEDSVWVLVGETDATSMIINNLELNRQYVFSLRVAIPTRGWGPPIYTSVTLSETLAPPIDFEFESTDSTITVRWDRGQFIPYLDDPNCGYIAPAPGLGAAFAVYVRELGPTKELPTIGPIGAQLVDYYAVTIPFSEQVSPSWVYQPRYLEGFEWSPDDQDYDVYRYDYYDPEISYNFNRNSQITRDGYLIPAVVPNEGIKEVGTTGTTSYTLTGLPSGHSFQVWVREIYPYDDRLYSLPAPLDAPPPAWCSALPCREYDCDLYDTTIDAGESVALWRMDDQGTDTVGATILATRSTYPLILDGGSDSSGTGLLGDICSPPDYSYDLSNITATSVGYGQNMVFTWAACVTTAAEGILFTQHYDTENQNSVSLRYSGSDIYIDFETRTEGAVSQVLTDVIPNAAHVIALKYEFNVGYEVYVDWAKVGVGTPPTDTLGGTKDERIVLSSNTTTAGLMNRVMYWDGLIRDSELASLKQAWAQNQSDYEDNNCYDATVGATLSVCPIGTIGAGLIVQTGGIVEKTSSTGYFSYNDFTPPSEDLAFNEHDVWFIVHVNTDAQGFPIWGDYIDHANFRRNANNDGWVEYPYDPIAWWLYTVGNVERVDTSSPSIGIIDLTSDGRVHLFYQDAPPVPEDLVNFANGAHKQFTVGDQWYDTNDGLRRHWWNGFTWAPVPGFSRINGINVDIRKNYFQGTQPISNLEIFDMWFDTSSDNNQQYVWDGDDWIQITNSTDNVVLAAANDSTATADGLTTTFYSSSHPQYDDDRFLGGDPYDIANYNLPELPVGHNITNYVNAVRANIIKQAIDPAEELDKGVGDIMVVLEVGASALYHWTGDYWEGGTSDGIFSNKIGRDCTPVGGGFQDYRNFNGIGGVGHTTYRSPTPPEPLCELIPDPSCAE